MTVVERQITINAPAETVFNYLADINRHVEWSGHELAVEQTSPGPVAQGSTFSTVGHMMGTHKATVKVTELTPSTRIAFEAADDMGHFCHRFGLEGEGNTTRLTKSCESTSLSGVFKVISPIADRLLVPRVLDGDLQRIKEKLEAS